MTYSFKDSSGPCGESRNHCDRRDPIPRLASGALSVGGGAWAILASLLLGLGARAQAPSPEDVAGGTGLCPAKGDCRASATDDGRLTGGRWLRQMPDGANLRTTRLNREGLRHSAIKCGRPGKGMPASPDRLRLQRPRTVLRDEAGAT